MSEEIFPWIGRYWGKARPPEGCGLASHPLVYHMLDVAAVARALLEARSVTRARGAALLGIGEAEALAFLPLLAALHDLGKFARPFQYKRSDLWAEALDGSIRPEEAHKHFDLYRRHDADGLLLWDGEEGLGETLSRRIWPGADERALLWLLQASFAHHGRPLSALKEEHIRTDTFGPGLADAAACAEALVRLLLPQSLAGGLTGRQARAASHWVAGFVTLADWLGSNTQHFPYAAPEWSLADYWALRLPAAREAVRTEGLAAAAPAAARGFTDLTGIEDAPSPLQRWAAEVALPPGPCLIVIEDVTGAGKTEAAQILVHRLLAAGRASGAYWALPTQATANALYLRQGAMIGRLYGGGLPPSLALAHGQAALSETFQRSIRRPDEPDELGYSQAEDAAEQTATAACAAFLADDRRTALLAEVGVGTLDQALLAALPAKFNTLRLFALAEKVLVIDEAHAYDAYVESEIFALLAFQARLGGSAIVLSATVTQAMREKLVTRWQEALGSEAPVPPAGNAYPLASLASAEGLTETPLKAAPRSRRRVPLRLTQQREEAVVALVEAARAGGAAVWIRNTVDDVLEAAEALRAEGLTPLVFHARFAQCDRQARERKILKLFGKHAEASRRAGQVLVASQVVEQSLDLDFDLMVSDLAPVDLLIQRAGRLRRHPHRDAERPAAIPFELLILSPPPDEAPGEGWIKSFLPGTAAVYDNPMVLWHSAHVLKSAGAIETPDGLRGLVEATYDNPEVLKELEAATLKAEGKQQAQRSAASFTVLQASDPYASSQPWEDERRVATRLIDGQVTLRLARLGPDGSLQPWCRDEQPDWKAWALSEIRVRTRLVPPDATQPRFAATVTALRATWGRWEQEIPVIVLEEDGEETWTATLSCEAGEKRLLYRMDSGLQRGTDQTAEALQPLVLSPRDSEAFAKALITPEPIKERLRDTARRYRERKGP